MAYTIPQIVGWMAVSQPLARIGEAKKRAKSGGTIDVDLDMKLFLTRRDLEYEYAQDPTSDNLFAMGNYGLSLCGIYLFQAINATGGGAVTPITPVTPAASILPLFFVVDASSPIATGESSATFTSFIGYNLLFSRNGVPQSTIVSEPSYYSWDSATGLFTCSPAAADLELFILMPV